MNIEVVAVTLALVAGVVGLLLGWKLGARNRLVGQEKARAEGRAESLVDLARLQERVISLETSVQHQRELESALERMRERSGSEAAAASAALATQREIVSRLTAQVEGATISIQNLQQRITDFTSLEQRLRSEITERDSALTAQRETVSQLRAQLESAGRRELQMSERITEFGALEHTLRGQMTERDATIQQVREQCGALRGELESTTNNIRNMQATQTTCQSEHIALQDQLTEIKVENAELQTSLDAERNHSEEKLNVLLSSRDALTNQFKSLASEILEEKSKRFTEQNAAALGQLLNPVREQLQAFHGKVDEVYRTEGQERAALGEQLKQLLHLNQSLSVDAQNLTRALKGDQKTQGTWGEIVLDTVLEQAGLIEGTHYDRQAAYEGEDQKRAIPDVVIRLPGDRQLVIDSKVSLTAYERGACEPACNIDQVRGVIGVQN